MFHFRSLNCIGYPCENVEHHSPIIRTHNLCWVLSNIDLHSIDNSIHKVQENKSVYEESKLKSDLSFRLYTAIDRYSYILAECCIFDSNCKCSFPWTNKYFYNALRCIHIYDLLLFDESFESRLAINKVILFAV